MAAIGVAMGDAELLAIGHPKRIGDVLLHPVDLPGYVRAGAVEHLAHQRGRRRVVDHHHRSRIGEGRAKAPSRVSISASLATTVAGPYPNRP